MGDIALVYKASAKILLTEAPSVYVYSLTYPGDVDLHIEAVMGQESSLDQPSDLTTVYEVYGRAVEL